MSIEQHEMELEEVFDKIAQLSNVIERKTFQAGWDAGVQAFYEVVKNNKWTNAADEAWEKFNGVDEETSFDLAGRTDCETSGPAFTAVDKRKRHKHVWQKTMYTADTLEYSDDALGDVVYVVYECTGCDETRPLVRR